jgi:hypothetical protein
LRIKIIKFCIFLLYKLCYGTGSIDTEELTRGIMQIMQTLHLVLVSEIIFLNCSFHRVIYLFSVVITLNIKIDVFFVLKKSILTHIEFM